MASLNPSSSVLAGNTVLVVDDRDNMRGLLRAILEDSGAIVFDAGSVRQAQEILAQSMPDAVLTDFELTPQWYGGVTILEDVRRRPPTCPVLLLTAWSDEYDKLVKLGFDAILLKPTHPADLV